MLESATFVEVSGSVTLEVTLDLTESVLVVDCIEGVKDMNGTELVCALA